MLLNGVFQPLNILSVHPIKLPPNYIPQPPKKCLFRAPRTSFCFGTAFKTQHPTDYSNLLRTRRNIRGGTHTISSIWLNGIFWRFNFSWWLSQVFRHFIKKNCTISWISQIQYENIHCLFKSSPGSWPTCMQEWCIQGAKLANFH